jgi:hypothetical protein
VLVAATDGEGTVLPRVEAARVADNDAIAPGRTTDPGGDEGDGGKAREGQVLRRVRVEVKRLSDGARSGSHGDYLSVWWTGK